METTEMRDFSEFCSQLNEMRARFHSWDSCERTVALYYLMVGLPFANARFLQNTLERCIAAVITPEAQVLERNANDPIYISRLMCEKPQTAVATLLAHLPLLKPGNRDAATSYLTTIRRVLSEFMTPYKIYNECVEIMSYVFVHPAFNKEDKKTFKQLLKQVVNRVCPENFIHSPMTESSDESSVSPNSEPVNYANPVLDHARLNRRSNSLTPAATAESLGLHQELWSSQENLSQPSPKPRSYSLSHDKAVPAVNAGTLQSSSSETRLQELQQTMASLPVMRSIMSWLKSLRLHKYSWVFNNLTYDQMLNLTEESLETIGITKGARHKLLISIAKLKERAPTLIELETDVINGGDVLNALKKLKCILQSPLQVTNGEDLSILFVKVMGKVCTQLLVLRHPSDEALVLFTTLCERAETLEAFTGEQKRRLSLWRSQVARGNHIPAAYRHQVNNGFHKHHHNTQYQNPSSSAPVAAVQQQQQHKSSSFPCVQNNATSLKKHRHSIGSVTLKNQLQQGGVNFIGSKNETGARQFHVRFQDVEPEEKTRKQKSVDIESSLESLCLQMMEHALGP